MSKWMNRLQEEMEKNKSASSQPLSVLSVPFRGLWEKNNEVLEPKIENPCFQPLSVLSVASRGLLEKKEERKSVINQQLSVLSVPDRGVSVKFYNVKNIEKDAYIPTDNTDIGSFVEEKLQPIDLPISFGVDVKDDIKNITDNPYTPTDNTDIGSFVEENTQPVDLPFSFGAVVKSDIKNITDNPHTPTDNTDIGSFAGEKNQRIDFSGSFADAIEMTRTRGKPKQIRESRWNAIVRRLDVLVDEENHHLLKMIEYGWSLQDVFGCHQFVPEMRFDSMGLLMLLTNSRIAEVHPERALVKSRSGQTMSYYLGATNRNLSECSTLMAIE